MYDKIFGIQHRLTVLRLYKTILRLHQSLPIELRALGNQYVRDEFRRHKNAQPDFVTNFMVEWSVSILPREKKRTKYDLFLSFLLFFFLPVQSSSFYDILFIRSFFFFDDKRVYWKESPFLFFCCLRRSTREY
jgi:hypothetical protein